MSKETGGAAFPNPYFSNSGMTLRDYFAAKAMQGFIGQAPSGTTFGVSYEDVNLGYAKAAYAMADAMIEAREQL